MKPQLTRYQAELARVVDEKYGSLSADRIVAELCTLGVIDHTLCKVIVVRRWVDEAVRLGDTKSAAMWRAADHFCATYEYIRNCMYHYTDVNI